MAFLFGTDTITASVSHDRRLPAATSLEAELTVHHLCQVSPPVLKGSATNDALAALFLMLVPEQLRQVNFVSFFCDKL